MAERVTSADALGIPPATVSNAYNRSDQLVSGLRMKGLETTKQLGNGGPDPTAQRLRSVRRGAIGSIVLRARFRRVHQPGAVRFPGRLPDATEAKDRGVQRERSRHTSSLVRREHGPLSCRGGVRELLGLLRSASNNRSPENPPIRRAKKERPGRMRTCDLRIRSGRFAGLFSSMR